MPEVRKYVLQKATYQRTMTLYFRLTDGAGSKTFKCFPLGPMVSFSKPEAQIDSFSNLHVLNQYYAQSFVYCVINPEGKLLLRQTHDFTKSRPTLRTDSQGRIFISGGVRRFTKSDFPAGPPPTFIVPTNDDAKP